MQSEPHQEIEEAFDAVVNLNGQIMPIKVLTKQHVQQQQHQQHDSRDMLTQNLMKLFKIQSKTLLEGIKEGLKEALHRKENFIFGYI